MISSTNKRQMYGPNRQGGDPAAVGLGSIHTSAAFDGAQDWRVRPAGLFDYPYTRLGRGFGSGPSLIPSTLPSLFGSGRNRRGGCATHSGVKLRLGRGFAPGIDAAIHPTSLRRFISSRLQFHRIGYQPGSYVSDPFERHNLERLSCPAQRPQTRARTKHAAGSITQGLGNV